MKPLRILGICGSPRKGNSEYLLKKALDAACKAAENIECDEYHIRGKKFSPCVACGKCGENGGTCIIRDDFAGLRDLWHRADVIIYSVPVYHMSMPGQLKCFIDRLGNETFGKYSSLFLPGHEKLPKLMKVIGSIAQGIHFSSGQEHTLTDLINHALLMQCIPVTGDMWQAYIGGVGWTANDPSRNALEKQMDKNEYDAMLAVQSAQDIGKRAVELALIIREGGLKRKQELIKDPCYKPFADSITES